MSLTKVSYSMINGAYANVLDFGAVGDGSTDDTAAIQAALDAALSTHQTVFLPAGTYCVKQSSTGSGYALLNKGVAMVGEGTFYSMIKAHTSMEAGTDFIRVTPDAGNYIDFLNFSRFSIQPTNGSTKYGRHCIFMNFPTITNCSFFKMTDICMFSGNDVSFKVSNDTAVNAQGVPANSLIEQCYFNEGSGFYGVGDSISIRNNVFRSSASSRPGIAVAQTTAAGTASMFVVSENNFICDGGAFIVTSGRNTKFINNNVEIASGSGTTNGAIIDIDGSGGLIPFSEITGNHIGIYGTSTPTSAIRINGSLGCNIANNTILSGHLTSKAVDITGSAGNTNIGFNEINSVNFTTVYSNSGGETSGTYVYLTPTNGFSNTSSYVPLVCMRYGNGVVTVTGALECPASPSGKDFATLPAGFYPSAVIRGACSATVSGSQSPQSIAIGPAGAMTYYGSNSATNIQFTITFFAEPLYSPLAY